VLKLNATEWLGEGEPPFTVVLQAAPADTAVFRRRRTDGRRHNKDTGAVVVYHRRRPFGGAEA